VEKQGQGSFGSAGLGDFRFSYIATASLIGQSQPGEDVADVIAMLVATAQAVSPGGASVVIDQVFSDCLDGLWEGGWQPAEVYRAARRRRSGRHGDLVTTAIAANSRRVTASPPSSWTEQLTNLGATDSWWGPGADWLGPWSLKSGIRWDEAVVVSVEALAVLLGLPKVEVLLPPPSQWSLGHTPGPGGVRVDEAVLAKVRALLAKAESTNFEHEADALTAKAQELMARHSIDEAVARCDAGIVGDGPIATRIAVDDPYSSAKSSLLAVVASANGVRPIWDPVFAHMTLVGFEADLEVVEMLFTSLMMQASKAMLARGRVADGRGRSRTRSFRHSFYLAFAGRIGERLAMAAASARSEAEADLGRDLLPVLAGRREEVDDTTARMFPRLRRARGSSVTNEAGWIAGRAAAETASLGPVRERLS
jgi:hypothetical protein